MFKKIVFATLSVAFILTFSGCNIPSPSATPDVNAAYTQVAQTFEARRTQEAMLTPTQAPTFTPTVTNTPAPATNTPLPPTPTIPAATNTPISAAADQCSYTGQNIADNTTFAPGAPIAITWTVRNSGTTTWTTDYLVRFYAGDMMGGTAQSKLGEEVKPNQDFNISMSLTAPTTPETYNTIWVITNPAANGGINFCSFNLIIKVVK